MCLAIPARIKSTMGVSAKVEIMGVESEVNMQLIESFNIGDYVLVHAGCAIERIDTEYFEYLQGVYETLIDYE